MARAEPPAAANREIIDDVLETSPATTSFLDARAAWWLACAGLLLLALIVALPALDRIPLDAHEIFVAQSTREMSTRGDWLVPYFNGVPRLNKPPMNYWLTGLVAGAAGALPDVAPAHARLVSVFAGIGLLGCTLALGVALFDRLTAVIAGGLLVSSAGFFSFTHDARPDMLYACFTSAMLWAGIRVLRAPPDVPPRLVGSVGVLWFAFACATLTKGPHLPALALSGLLVHAALRARGLRGPWRALRPWPGLAIVAVPTLAWWGWLRVRVDPATLGDSQLAGSLLTPAWSRLGDPYYLYRPLELLLPWLPLIGMALAGIGLMRAARRDTGWLWWPLLVAAIGLSFGKQYRYFYLLPLMVPLVLVFARAIAVVIGATLRPWPRQWVQLALLLQGLLAVACAGWVLVASGRIAYLTPPILSVVLGGLGAWLLWRALKSRDDGTPAARGLAIIAAMAVFTALIWPGAALTGVLWSRERFDAQLIVDRAADEVRAGRPLVTLGVSPSLYVYATNRRVRALDDAAQVMTLARDALDFVLVARSDRLPELGPPLVISELARARRGSRDDVLVRVQMTEP